MNDLATSNADSMLSKLVVEQGLATLAEVEEVKLLQQEGSQAGDPSNTTLAELLVTNGVVTERQINRLRPAIEQEKPSSQQIPGFKIVSKLGAGAMATVFKAHQLSLDRMVAIKVLPRKHTNNPEFVQRFYDEGKAAGKLNHPNIVQAIDVGQAGEYHYFVMEYVEGRSVYDDLQEKGRYTEAEAIKIILDVGQALEHAHAQGIMHRDVKPKNIMLTAEGMAKLADMGLARAVSDREAAEAEAGKAFGTPYYISPEQIRGQTDVDFRADIYSMGATLYHMVTGRVPFEGPNPNAVMQKHLRSNLTAPDEIVPELSKGICEIIDVCMAKNRDRRYATTSNLMEDLRSVAKGEPPAQARQQFDFSQLAALSNPAEETQQLAAQDDEPGLTEQPLFWAAVFGWGIATVLLIAVVVLAIASG